jgi:hydrogenase maturation protease
VADVIDMETLPNASTQDAPLIAVIGCGNPTRSDDGVGCEVVRRLAAGALGRDARIRLLDAGTDGMQVMFVARGCRTLIIVDVCRSGSDPGALFEVPGDELRELPPPSITLHDFRWDHALFAGHKMFGGAFPQDVLVLLIEASTLAFGIGLSDVVAAALHKAVARIEEIVAARLRGSGKVA